MGFSKHKKQKLMWCVLGVLLVFFVCLWNSGLEFGGVFPDGTAALEEAVPASVSVPPVAKRVSAQNRDLSANNGGRKNAAAFTLVSATPKETRFCFSAGEFSVIPVELHGKSYTRLEMEGAWGSQVKGHPSLPMVRTELAVPVAKGSRLEVVSEQWEEIACAPPIPSAGMVRRGEKAEVCEAEEIYSSSDVYPSRSNCLMARYFIRNVACSGVVVMPMAYDFKRGVLRVCRSMELRLVTEASSVDDYGELAVNADWKKIQTARVLNTSLLRSETQAVQGGVGRVLVIAPDAWKGNLASYKSWKEYLGYRVTVLGYPSDTGEGRDGVAASIRSAYTADGITHVVLVGKHGQVPSAVYDEAYLEQPGEYLGVSDVPYVLVSGDDWRSDVFLSRLPVETEAELLSVLEKLKSYEAATFDASVDDRWRGTGVGISSDITYGKDQEVPEELWYSSDYLEMEKAKTSLSEAGIWVESTHLSDAKALVPRDDVEDALNLGGNLVNYLGHGISTAWGTGLFPARCAITLTNGARLPLICGYACETANFGYPDEDCLGAAFLKNASGGGCGYFGSVNETFYYPPVFMMHGLDDAVNQSSGGEALITQGAYALTAINSGIEYCETTTAELPIPVSGLDPVEMVAKQFHLLGDCTLAGRFVPLKELQAEALYTPAGRVVSVQVREEGSGLAGALVCLHGADSEEVISATTDSDGVALLRYSDASGALSVSVYHPRHGVSEITPRSLDTDGDGRFSATEFAAAYAGAEECARQNVVAIWESEGVAAPEPTVVESPQLEPPIDGTQEYASVVAAMEGIVSAYPRLARPVYIGTTERGVRILGIRLKNDQGQEYSPLALLTAGWGGAGEEGVSDVLEYCRLMCEAPDGLSDATLVVIPCINPDGEAGVKTGFPDGTQETVGRFEEGASLLMKGRLAPVASLMRWCCANNLVASGEVGGTAVAGGFESWLMACRGVQTKAFAAGKSPQETKGAIAEWLTELAAFRVGVVDELGGGVPLARVSSGTVPDVFTDKDGWAVVCGVKTEACSVTVSAYGYQGISCDIQKDTPRICVLERSGNAAVVSKRVHIPGQASQVVISVPVQGKTRAFECRIDVPSHWKLETLSIEPNDGVLTRWESDGIMTVMFSPELGLGSEERTVAVSLSPGEGAEEDGVTTVWCSESGQTLVCPSASAEPIFAELSVKAGEMAGLPAYYSGTEPLPFSGVERTEDGRWQRMVFPQYGRCFVAENGATASYTGYFPPDVQMVPGWNLVGVPLKMPAACVDNAFIRRGSRYTRPQWLFPGNACWMFRR